MYSKYLFFSVLLLVLTVSKILLAKILKLGLCTRFDSADGGGRLEVDCSITLQSRY